MGSNNSRQSIGADNIHTGNSFNSNNVISITLNPTADEDSQIMQWLSPLQPEQKHKSVRGERIEGVGGWLLQRKGFREWSDSQRVLGKAVLFCYGHPGVGKTYISSLVIDWLYNQADRQGIVVSILYCDYQTRKEQSAANILGAILRQLSKKYGIPGAARQAFREGEGLGWPAMKRVDLVEILKTTVASRQGVFICIDALDECLPEHRLELLVSLKEIVRASPTTRVFLSGRPHIRNEVKKYFAAAMISVAPTNGDIRTYLKMRLDRDLTPEAMNGNLKTEIMKAISTEIPPIFLLISLSIDAVLEEVTIHQRRRKLEEMTQGSGLRDAYSATLARIKEQGGGKTRLAMQVLLWLSHSERHLRVSELCNALGVEIEPANLHPENVPEINTVLDCSLGLVTVEASSRIVRLIHPSLQEFLSNNTDLFHSPHLTIAQACLTYLHLPCIRDLSRNPGSPLRKTPLLGYTSCFWGTHLKRQIPENVNPLALKLLSEFDKHVSSKVLLYHNPGNWDRELCLSNAAVFTGIHCAAYFGLIVNAVELLEMKKWYLDATDVEGNTAISWAARKGHREMVEMLLEREDVTPDTADKDGRTPLSWAAGNGHEGIVAMLLKRTDVGSNTEDKDGRTPLSWAVERGHTRVVAILSGELLSASQDAVISASTTQISLIPVSGKQRGGALKRRFEDLSSAPGSWGSNSPISLSPAESSEPSHRLFKKPRGSRDPQRTLPIRPAP